MILFIFISSLLFSQINENNDSISTFKRANLDEIIKYYLNFYINNGKAKKLILKIR